MDPETTNAPPVAVGVNSETDSETVRYAAREAVVRRAPLHVLHVVDPAALAPGQGGAGRCGRSRLPRSLRTQRWYGRSSRSSMSWRNRSADGRPRSWSTAPVTIP